MNLPIKLFQNQVSGKTAKFVDQDQKYIYKKLSKRQQQFYNFMEGCTINSRQYQLKKCIPKYLGKVVINSADLQHQVESTSKKGQWINHIIDRNKTKAINQCIVLQNLQKGYKYACSIDVKLGKKKQKKKSNKKFQQSTTNSHNFRINGMSNLFVQKNQPHFISKYYFQKTSEQQIETHLAFFFFNGNQIDIQLLKKCIQQIKQIVLALKCFKNGDFDSASLLILYDAYDHSKFQVKIIDFDKYMATTKQNQNGDQNIIIGLQYIIWYLNNIINNHQFHEKLIKQEKIKVFDNFEVVPAQKIVQFSGKSIKSLKSQDQKSQ